MGASLGYLFYLGGNLSYAILAHFVNNAAAVIIAYMGGRVISEDAFENFGSELSIWVIGSLTLVGLMLWAFGRKAEIST